MNLESILSTYVASKQRKTYPHHLKIGEYREHYPLVVQAVKNGVPLHAVVRIIRDQSGAFAGKSDACVWQAYNRALKASGISLKGK